MSRPTAAAGGGGRPIAGRAPRPICRPAAARGDGLAEHCPAGL